jgi:hypothetical protein
VRAKIDLRHWNKGGKREGSGRKTLGKVQLAIRVSHATDEFLRLQAKINDTTISEVFERLVQQSEDFKGDEHPE